MLVVTHDPRIVPFADRIVRIEDGKIIGEERASDSKDAAATTGKDDAERTDKPSRKDRKRKS